ncbi:MAG: hypothetical protein AB2551_03990 [Candidatus Thiodiazotropha sp.]
MRRLFTLITALLVLSGCGISYVFTNHHLKMIKEGEKPKVALVVSLPNSIYIEYFGFTVFENRSHTLPSSANFEDIIYEKTSEIITREGIAEVYEQTLDERTEFVDGLAYETRYYWDKNILSDEDKKAIFDWAKPKDIDFVAFVFPGRMQMTPESPIVITSKALIANYGGVNNPMLVNGIKLFDVNHLEWASYSGKSTIIRDSPALKKKLSQEEIDEIKSNREIESHDSFAHELRYPTLEAELISATFFQGDDYGTLTEADLTKIDDLLLSQIEDHVHKLLINTGFAKGKNMPTWESVNDNKTSVERVSE